MKLFFFAVALHMTYSATLDIDNNVIPVVEKGFPVRQSTRNLTEMLKAKE